MNPFSIKYEVIPGILPDPQGSLCSDCFTIKKIGIPASPLFANVGDPVQFEIEICGNNQTGSIYTVDLNDILPTGFIAAPPVSFPMTSIPVPPIGSSSPTVGCTTIVVTGVFDDIYTCPGNENQATIYSLTPNLTATACIEVNCPGPGDKVVTPSNNLASNIFNTNPVNGEVIEIEPNVVLNFDVNMTFNNCTFIVGPGGGIDIGMGITLDISHTNIFGCPKMWTGIHMQPTSSIFASHSSIRDANIAIEADENCSITIDDSYIVDCITGILTLPVGFNSTTMQITSSHFGRILPQFKMDYAGQPIHGLIGRAGVVLNDLASIAIGNNNFGQNEFFTLNHGIELYKSNVTITNSRFNNIFPDPAYLGSVYNLPSPLGCAITARSDRDYPSSLTVLPLTSNLNTIINSNIGVYNNSVATDILGVKMDPVDKGIISENNAYISVNALNNTINASAIGIQWSLNDLSFGMNAEENNITIGPLGFGIQLSELNTTYPSGQLHLVKPKSKDYYSPASPSRSRFSGARRVLRASLSFATGKATVRAGGWPCSPG